MNKIENILEIIEFDYLTAEQYDYLKKYIRRMQKKAELGEHYKHLYSEVKKQQDDVVEYINTAIEEGNYFEDDIDTDIQLASYDKYVNSVEILRMLGEIDEYQEKEKDI